MSFRYKDKNVKLIFTNKIENKEEYLINDFNRFTQILFNLLQNALKFTESGGKVFVKFKLFLN